MIKAELKRVPFKMRVELADLARVKYSLDGTYEVSKAFTVASEFASAGLFGKRLGELSEEELCNLILILMRNLLSFAKGLGFS